MSFQRTVKKLRFLPSAEFVRPTVVTFMTDSPPLSIDRNDSIQSGTPDAVGGGGVHFIH